MAIEVYERKLGMYLFILGQFHIGSNHLPLLRNLHRFYTFLDHLRGSLLEIVIFIGTSYLVIRIRNFCRNQ